MDFLNNMIWFFVGVLSMFVVWICYYMKKGDMLNTCKDRLTACLRRVSMFWYHLRKCNVYANETRQPTMIYVKVRNRRQMSHLRKDPGLFYVQHTGTLGRFCFERLGNRTGCIAFFTKKEWVLFGLTPNAMSQMKHMYASEKELPPKYVPEWFSLDFETEERIKNLGLSEMSWYILPKEKPCTYVFTLNESAPLRLFNCGESIRKLVISDGTLGFNSNMARVVTLRDADVNIQHSGDDRFVITVTSSLLCVRFGSIKCDSNYNESIWNTGFGTTNYELLCRNIGGCIESHLRDMGIDVCGYYDDYGRLSL